MGMSRIMALQKQLKPFKDSYDDMTFTPPRSSSGMPQKKAADPRASRA